MANESWVLATVLLCLYGFFKEMRPSEPFLTPYLRNYKNLTAEEVDNEIYPIWTYSYLFALVFVFLLTDFLRYKPVIIVEVLTYLATWSLLIWGNGLQAMLLMQFFYGLATATEIAYYSYIYAIVSPQQYRKVTSYTRTAILTGDFTAGVLGQILVSSHITTTYFLLNVISFVSLCVAFVISIFLPPTKKSVYFHRDSVSGIDSHHVSLPPPPQCQKSDENTAAKDEFKDVMANEDITSTEGELYIHQNSDTNCVQDDYGSIWDSTQSSQEDLVIRTNTYADDNIENQSPKRKRRIIKVQCTSCKGNFQSLLTDFKSCYSSSHLLKWSLWWAFATCGYFQIGNYVQNLWDLIEPSTSDDSRIYNGAVDAVSTLSGAFATFILAFIKFNWTIFGELTLGIVSTLDAVILCAMGFSSNIWLSYAFYILFRSSYQLLITIATFQIASHLTTERYALVFGCNSFVALALQSLLTLIVVDKHGLNLPADVQFCIYGGYYFVIGTIFMAKAVYTLSKSGWIISCQQRWVTYKDEDADSVEEKYLQEEMEKNHTIQSDIEEEASLVERRVCVNDDNECVH
ncbi:thiamine transporter 2-like [Saccoglossus kowalevskii]|uniref:Thiamine transporter 2-like n=1 Tax=Saccoglossus kowalevskii TaxID=10224 RepID=A0ABM0GTB3_SACKO|nr:PREDICTED: thiamine transporter 2-like [Saccoglossus kowalevskii]